MERVIKTSRPQSVNHQYNLKLHIKYSNERRNKLKSRTIITVITLLTICLHAIKNGDLSKHLSHLEIIPLCQFTEIHRKKKYTRQNENQQTERSLTN